MSNPFKRIGKGLNKAFRAPGRELARFAKKQDEKWGDKLFGSIPKSVRMRMLNTTIGGPGLAKSMDYEGAEMEGRSGWLAVRQAIAQDAVIGVVALATYFTGGGTIGAIGGAGSTAATISTGALVGGGLSAGSTALQGGNLEDIGKGFGTGFVAGGVGAGAGALVGPGTGLMGAATQGAVVGGVGNATNTALQGGNSSDILQAGAAGGAVGGLAGAARYGMNQQPSVTPAAEAPQADAGDMFGASPNPNAPPTNTTMDSSVSAPGIGDKTIANLTGNQAPGSRFGAIGDFVKSPGGGLVAAGAMQAAGGLIGGAGGPDEEEALRARQRATNLEGVNIGFSPEYEAYQMPDLVAEYDKFVAGRGYGRGS
ncbi:hypothetical protein [Sphingomonas sp.]|jgi:hypothetical protein|uniref:hypothetical protein n=1 Tax=Sphingomonas sp. TaxID=28214 RepID=UPI0035673CF7